jgi:acyl-CoA thioester hydrolase
MNLHPPAMIPSRAHRYTTRVYYEDTDAGGVVYHAAYLRLAERARTEALRDLGASHAEMTARHGLMFVVRRAAIDYLAPARLDDSVVVATWPSAIGRARVDLRQTFWRGEVALAAAEIVLVCVRRDESRAGGLAAAGIPDRWRDALASLAAGETG